MFDLAVFAIIAILGFVIGVGLVEIYSWYAHRRWLRGK